MDHYTELRRTYLAAVPHTIFTAMVWLVASFLFQQSKPTQAITFFIIAGSFVFPGGELLRKLMRAPNLVTEQNKLPQFFMLLAFTIPASYPLIYFACRENVNLFFPAFTVLVGAHYLPFVFGYRMFTFAILAILLVAQGTLTGLFLSTHAALSGFLTGGTLLVFACIHYLIVKKEIH